VVAGAASAGESTGSTERHKAIQSRTDSTLNVTGSPPDQLCRRDAYSSPPGMDARARLRNTTRLFTCPPAIGRLAVQQSMDLYHQSGYPVKFEAATTVWWPPVFSRPAESRPRACAHLRGCRGQLCHSLIPRSFPPLNSELDSPYVSGRYASSVRRSASSRGSYTALRSQEWSKPSSLAALTSMDTLPAFSARLAIAGQALYS